MDSIKDLGPQVEKDSYPGQVQNSIFTFCIIILNMALARYHCLFLWTCFMAAMMPEGMAQRVVVSNSGDSIIKFPDGTWRAPNAGDSLILRQYNLEAQASAAFPPGNPNANQKNQSEVYTFLMKQWKEVYSNLLSEEKEVQNAFRSATNAQFKAGQQLRIAESNKKLVEPDKLATLFEAYENSVQDLRMSKLQQKEIKSIVEKSRKINSKPAAITQSKVTKVKSSYNTYLVKYYGLGKIPALPPPTVNQVTTSSPADPPGATPVKKQSTTPAPAYDPSMIHKRPAALSSGQYVAQPYACLFDTDSIEQPTGRRRRELHPDILFTYTDPDLRPFFRDKDLITCRGRISGIGPYTYLSVEFQIASSHSQSNFGTLAEGSLLRFNLMNGDFVSLYNLKAHQGRIDPYSGYTIFAGQYALGKAELKKLSKSELHEMRVLWGTGYEDYDVYNIDMLVNQLKCLANKN